MIVMQSGWVQRREGSWLIMIHAASTFSHG